MADLRAHEEEECSQEDYDQKINYSDADGSAFGPFLNAGDSGVHQIGEKNCEKKGYDRPAGDVKKTEAQSEKEDGKEYASRA
jgi:hypothetical protein